MKKISIILCFLLISSAVFAQNCEVFLSKGDTLQYKACKLVEHIEGYQFSRKFQEKFDEALKICPYFSYAYREKSTAYLKSGDFLTWKKLIDKAVEYDWKGNLAYRGWCRYQFFRDYQGAINDIEKLDSLVSYNIGYSVNGDYHLNIAKALCYSALNQKKKAIELIENQLKTENYSAGWHDYYQLGVTYFEVKDYKNAVRCFEKQNSLTPLAENEYYLAKFYKLQKNQLAYKQHKANAIKLYEAKKYLFDGYTHHFNKIFLDTIINE